MERNFCAYPWQAGSNPAVGHNDAIATAKYTAKKGQKSYALNTFAVNAGFSVPLASH